MKRIKPRRVRRGPRPLELLSRSQAVAFRAHRRAARLGLSPSARQRAAFSAYLRLWRFLRRSRWQ
jgi:hypothetical protein